MSPFGCLLPEAAARGSLPFSFLPGRVQAGTPAPVSSLMRAKKRKNANDCEELVFPYPK